MGLAGEGRKGQAMEASEEDWRAAARHKGGVTMNKRSETAKDISNVEAWAEIIGDMLHHVPPELRVTRPLHARAQASVRSVQISAGGRYRRPSAECRLARPLPAHPGSAAAAEHWAGAAGS